MQAPAGARARSLTQGAAQCRRAARRSRARSRPDIPAPPGEDIWPNAELGDRDRDRVAWNSSRAWTKTAEASGRTDGALRGVTLASMVARVRRRPAVEARSATDAASRWRPFLHLSRWRFRILALLAVLLVAGSVSPILHSSMRGDDSHVAIDAQRTHARPRRFAVRSRRRFRRPDARYRSADAHRRRPGACTPASFQNASRSSLASPCCHSRASGP